jgi:citrate lyase subunit beta / citryl-CoA lyase
LKHRESAQVSHPDKALFGGEKALPALPGCEHFAGSEKFILKAFALQSELGAAFDVTCDCEDGAPVGAEREHAELVARLIGSAQNRAGRAGVRIHDPAHPAWRQDVDILLAGAGPHIAYMTVPKPTSYDQAAQAVDYILGRAAANGVKAPPIHFIIETQSALRDVFRIAGLPGLEALVFGLLDFVSDHRGAIGADAMRSPTQFAHHLVCRARTEIAAAALVNGLIPTHNPCLAFDDPPAAGEDARRARELFGYMRMYSIHPAQIRPIVEAMQPSQADVTRAGEILLAAQAADWGPVSHRGEMHDRASYRYFWDLLKRARATGVQLSVAAEQAFFSNTN